MNVKALKKQLKEMGLSTNGKKSDLEFRLAYQTDENGIVYGYCTVCNRDLRDELFDEE